MKSNKPVSAEEKRRATVERQRHTNEQGRRDRNQNPYQWDSDKIFAVAKDRGFLTKDGAIYFVSKHLGLTRNGAKTLLESGNMSWGQVLTLGALFEMTPKEFCDTFMASYFVEVSPNNFRAYVDNTDQLLRRLYKITAIDHEAVAMAMVKAESE